MKKTFLILTLIALSILTPSVFGYTVQVDPSPLKVDEVLVGTEKLYDITVHTDNVDDTIVQLYMGGAIADFTTVEPHELVISKNSPGTAVIKVKTDQKGTHFGHLIVDMFSDSMVTSSVRESNSIPVTVKVTENEILDADLRDLFAYDIFKGDNFGLEFEMENTGNVKITPKLSLSVLSQDKKTQILYFKHDLSELTPGQESLKKVDQELFIEPGVYYARVDLLVEDMVFKRAYVKFKVYDDKMQMRTGIFTSYDPVFIVDPTYSKIDITGTFRNTGDKPTTATMMTLLYLEGEIVERLESSGEQVNSQSARDFNIEYRPEKSGQYTILSYFTYDDTKTVEKSADIQVEVAENIELGMAPFVILLMFVGFVVLVIVIKKREGKIKN